MKKVILSQLILITSILISCTDKLENTEVNNNPTNQVVLTSNEYASIAYDNPKELSEDEITNVIYDFKRINSEFKKQFITTKEDKPMLTDQYKSLFGELDFLVVQYPSIIQP